MSYKLIESIDSIQEVYVMLSDRPMMGSLYYDMSRTARGKNLIINNESNNVFRESKIFKVILISSTSKWKQKTTT
jgi:hypothetical protein